MPRIYTSESYPVDYCRRCFPRTEAQAYAIHGHDGDGPDERGNCFGYDCEHPDYADDSDMYTCYKCNKSLEFEY
jgi:hypothetical protein